MIKFIVDTIIPTVYAVEQRVDLSVSLRNPLKVGTIPKFIAAILDIVISIGTWVAVFFIIYSGFLFIKARGDVKGLETAKKTFFGTVIGTAILLGAFVIAAAVRGTITQLGAP